MNAHDNLVNAAPFDELPFPEDGMPIEIARDGKITDQKPRSAAFYAYGRAIHTTYSGPNGLPDRSMYSDKSLEFWSRAREKREEKDHKEAAHLFSNAIAIEPFFWEAKLNRANELMLLGQLDAAALDLWQITSFGESYGSLPKLRRMAYATLGTLYLEAACLACENSRTQAFGFAALSDAAHAMAVQLSDTDQGAAMDTPEAANVYYDWTVALLLLGEPHQERAEWSWSNALQLDPERRILAEKLNKHPELTELTD